MDFLNILSMKGKQLNQTAENSTINPHQTIQIIVHSQYDMHEETTINNKWDIKELKLFSVQPVDVINNVINIDQSIHISRIYSLSVCLNRHTENRFSSRLVWISVLTNKLMSTREDIKLKPPVCLVEKGFYNS